MKKGKISAAALDSLAWSVYTQALSNTDIKNHISGGLFQL
jgi:hypothetical protein